MHNSSFWKYYLAWLEHNAEADKFTLNNDSEMGKVSTLLPSIDCQSQTYGTAHILEST